MKKGHRTAEARGPVGTAHLDSEWQRKGASLSDKTARKEFGLTQEEILRAIRTGALQYRQNSVFGNPYLRLLRREVEALVASKRGRAYVQHRRATAEVARINLELKRLKTLVSALERRRSELLRDIDRAAPAAPRALRRSMGVKGGRAPRADRGTESLGGPPGGGPRGGREGAAGTTAPGRCPERRIPRGCGPHARRGTMDA